MQGFKPQVKIFLIVLVVAVIIAVGGVLLLRDGGPNQVWPMPARETSISQQGINVDSVELVLLDVLSLPEEERAAYKFKRDGGVTYHLNVNIFDQARDGVIRGELQIYDEEQGEWQKHEFVDPRNDLEYLYYLREGLMGDPLMSQIRFKSEISQMTPNEERMRLVFYDYPIGCEGGNFEVNKAFCLEQRVEIASQEFTVEAGEVSTVDTFDWQTYQNDEFGFKMKYPENFITDLWTGPFFSSLSIFDPEAEQKLEDTQGELSFSGAVYVRIIRTNKDIASFIKEEYTHPFETNKSGVTEQTDVVFSNGMPAIRVKHLTPHGEITVTLLQSKEEGLVFEFSKSLLHESTLKNAGYPEGVFDEILATFRFIE